MVKRSLWLFSFCLFVSPFASSLAGAQQEKPPAPFTFQPGQSVYVVAVRHNTPMTPEVWKELRQNSRSRGATASSTTSGSQDPGGRATLERTLPERPTLDRTAEPMLLLNRPADQALTKAVTDVLRKQKKFKLVDAVEQADFVLLVQGEYVASQQQRFSGNGDSRGSVGVFNGNPDSGEATEGNQLVRIQARAIPATLYRQANQRLPDNAETVRWRGHLAGSLEEGFTAPSIESFARVPVAWRFTYSTLPAATSARESAAVMANVAPRPVGSGAEK